MGWLTFCNGRQIIETAIRGGKHVFQMHHLKVHSVAGLAIEKEFASFGSTGCDGQPYGVTKPSLARSHPSIGRGKMRSSWCESALTPLPGRYGILETVC